jgi:hypothetical protein
MKPGFYESLAYAEYDQIEACRFSNLKYLERSPLAYQYHRDNLTPPTAPMILGNAAHLAILEPSMVNFAVWPGPGRRFGKEWDAWCAENSGKTLLNEKEALYVAGMKAAVHSNPVAAKYLRHGKKELTMVWRDPSFKREFKARVDNFVEIDDEPVLVSLKSTVDCRDFRFASQYAKMCYHCQDTIYQNGFLQLQHQLPRMVTVAIESRPPHESAVYRITNDALRQGQQLVSKWMETLAECERTNKWPAAVEGEIELQLPSWAFPGGDFQFDDLEAIER